MSGIRFRYLRTSALSERADPILQIDNLHVRVGIRRVINNLSLSVNEGESLLVEGPNGSGKTSLFNAIAGLEPAHIESGTIRFDGKDITSDAPHERSKAGLAYLRQRDNVFLELTVKDNLHLALGEKGPEQFKARFPNWALDLPLNKNANLLSGGQKQKLAWSMVVLQKKRFLLADEPEAGLSESLQLPENISSLIISHNSSFIESNLEQRQSI